MSLKHLPHVGHGIFSQQALLMEGVNTNFLPSLQRLMVKCLLGDQRVWTALKSPLLKRYVNCSYLVASRSKVELGWNWKYYSKVDLHGSVAVKGIWFYYIRCYWPDSISSFPIFLYEYSFTNNGYEGVL